MEYNSDPQHHLNLRNEELGKSTKKRGRAPAAAEGPDTPSRQKSETPSRQKTDLWVEVPARAPGSAVPPSEEDRPASPVSTASSVSETPLAQSVKANGQSAPRPATPESPRPANAPTSSPGEAVHGYVSPHVF